MYDILIRKGVLNMKSVLIVGGNGRVCMEGRKILVEKWRFNVDLFLRNGDGIGD